MSWIEDVTELELIIITGDGEEYRPQYLKPRRKRRLNAVPIEFNDIPGALVLRGETSYTEYSLELYFQGEDHLEVAERFDESANDRRNWTINHPYYKSYEPIICQPVSIDQNNKNDNVSKFTVKVIETIDNVNPSYADSLAYTVQKAVNDAQSGLNEGAIQAVEPGMEEIMLPAFLRVLQAVTTSSELEAVKGAIADAKRVINEAEAIAAKIETTMGEIANVLRAPGRFIADVKTRLNSIVESYEDMKNAFNGFSSLFEKNLFESAGGITVIAAVETSVIPVLENAETQDVDTEIVDYLSRKDVFTTIDTLTAFYEDYIKELGDMSSEDDNTLESYYPNGNTIFLVKDAVQKATGNLLKIAADARIERTYTLTEDMPLLVLTGKLLGSYKKDDVESFIRYNDFLRDEFIVIKKGRKVVYYV